MVIPTFPVISAAEARMRVVNSTDAYAGFCVARIDTLGQGSASPLRHTPTAFETPLQTGRVRNVNVSV